MPRDEKTLAAELQAALPSGSSAAQVKQYLDARKVEHSELTSHKGYGHLGRREDESSIAAIVRNVRRSPLVTTDITMEFTFDSQQRLIKTDVKEGHTGP